MCHLIKTEDCLLGQINLAFITAIVHANGTVLSGVMQFLKNLFQQDVIIASGGQDVLSP